MSTVLNPVRPPSLHRGPGRIVERTTTITREIFLDDPRHTHEGTDPASQTDAAASPAPQSSSTGTDAPIHGLDLALMRLGVWLIKLGRQHSLHSTRSGAFRTAAGSDEIARRVDAAKAHDMRHFIGLPY